MAKQIVFALLRLPLWCLTVVVVLACGLVLWIYDQFPEEWLE